jgi:hypothetical protein
VIVQEAHLCAYYAEKEIFVIASLIANVGASMPAIDRYQAAVINALRKVGWQAMNNPYLIIILEIKGFEGRSAIDNLEEAVGQYMIYRALLDEIAVPHPLYLAVPLPAFEGILSESVGQVVRKRLGIKLIVFDVKSEEIVQWID